MQLVQEYIQCAYTQKPAAEYQKIPPIFE